MKKMLLTVSILISCSMYANSAENYDLNLNEIKIEKLDTISVKDDLDLEMKKINDEMNKQVINEIKQNKLKLTKDLISKKKQRNLLNNI